MLHIISATLLPLFFAGIAYLYFFAPVTIPEENRIFCEKAPVYFSHIRMLDTIHLLGDEYIEILLDRQLALLHRRNDSILTFKISTGNKYISKGMATPPGFFTIQTMLEVATSRQFNNAKLFYWLGFNGNIGFHGLRTSGYYAHLGRRPSSHGCVRIAREDGKSLYRKVHRGTPVIVYKNKPAIRITFSDYSDFNPEYDFFLTENSRFNQSIMRTRLKYLYKGLALTYNSGRVFIDGKTVMKPRGFDIGLDSLVPNRQKPPVYDSRTLCINKDKLFTGEVLPDTSKKNDKLMLDNTSERN